QNNGIQCQVPVWHGKCPISDAIGGVDEPMHRSAAETYSAAGSLSITTFKCAVTSLCSLTGTVNSTRVFNGSWSWILRRSMLKTFLGGAAPKSLEFTDPNSWSFSPVLRVNVTDTPSNCFASSSA